MYFEKSITNIIMYNKYIFIITCISNIITYNIKDIVIYIYIFKNC